MILKIIGRERDVGEAKMDTSSINANASISSFHYVQNDYNDNDFIKVSEKL